MPKKLVKYHYKPTTGVRDDFFALMNEFLDLKTVRFTEFSAIWRAKKMSFLCAGRFSTREAREFIEAAFAIALDFFLPPYQFQVRVGGLYLLYAVFETQPIAPRAQVRLTQAQWKETLQFQQEASQQNHLDVVYIFNKMLQDHAFMFCATSVEMSVRAHQQEPETTELNLAADLTEDRRDIDTLFNYEAMEQLSYLLDHYQQMKVTLAGPEATQPDKSLDVVQGTMVEDLLSVLQSFKTTVGNIHKHGKPSDPNSNQAESSQSVESTGSRRRAIKAKAYSQVATSRGRKTFVVTVDEGPSNEESQQQSDDHNQDENFQATNTKKAAVTVGPESHLMDGNSNVISKGTGNALSRKTHDRAQHSHENVKEPVGKFGSHVSQLDSPNSNTIRVEVYSKSKMHVPMETIGTYNDTQNITKSIQANANLENSTQNSIMSSEKNQSRKAKSVNTKPKAVKGKKKSQKLVSTTVDNNPQDMTESIQADANPENSTQNSIKSAEKGKSRKTKGVSTKSKATYRKKKVAPTVDNDTHISKSIQTNADLEINTQNSIMSPEKGKSRKAKSVNTKSKSKAVRGKKKSQKLVSITVDNDQQDVISDKSCSISIQCEEEDFLLRSASKCKGKKSKRLKTKSASHPERNQSNACGKKSGNEDKHEELNSEGIKTRARDKTWEGNHPEKSEAMDREKESPAHDSSDSNASSDSNYHVPRISLASGKGVMVHLQNLSEIDEEFFQRHKNSSREHHLMTSSQNFKLKPESVSFPQSSDNDDGKESQGVNFKKAVNTDKASGTLLKRKIAQRTSLSYKQGQVSLKPQEKEQTNLQASRPRKRPSQAKVERSSKQRKLAD